MFKNGEKFGIVTWDWKAHGPAKSERQEMKDKGLIFRDDIPEEFILSDCFAAIYSDRPLSDDEIEFAWEQYQRQYDPDAYVEVSGNIFQVYDTTWEERHKDD